MQMWQGKKCRPILRIISAIVVFTFTVTTVAWADGQGGIIGTLTRKTSQESSPIIPGEKEALTNLKQLFIPFEIGEIKSSYQGLQKRLVIHIQDAHVNEEAQRNIGRIIEFLEYKTGAKLISVEGASGDLNTAIFAAFPDEKARQAVADYYLKEGKLTGPEHLAITKKAELKLFGAEDKELYEENRKAFLDALKFKDKDKDNVEEIRHRLDQVSRFVFSDTLRKLRGEHAGYQKQKSYVGHYVNYLVQLADELKVSRYRYRQIDSFLRLNELERKIDFEKAEKEIDVLIDDLKKILNREELSKFVTNTIQFRLEKISRKEYYGYLKDKMSTYPEQEKKYENVLNYLTYMSHYDSIGIELFQEIDTLEEDLKNKLFRNDSEVTLDRLYRFVDILEHLFDFSLTKEDADYFYSYRDEINVENFRTFIEDEARKAKQTLMLPKEVDLINQDIPKIEKFYQAALKRDHELIDRAYRKMVDSNGQVSIIVTGGFHTPGIERYLKEKDTSYLVIAPRITKTIDERKESKLYEAAMKNEPTRLEKMLAEVYMPPKSTTLNDPRYQLGQPKVTAMTISDFVRSGYPDKNWAASKVTLDRVIPMFLEMARRYQTLGGLNRSEVDDGWGGFLDVGFEALGERTNQKYDRNLQTEKIAERSEMRKTAANGLVIELVPTVLNGKEIRPRSEIRQKGAELGDTMALPGMNVEFYRATSWQRPPRQIGRA